jgi:hypothetical protein
MWLSKLKYKFTSFNITIPVWPILLFFACFTYKLYFLLTHLSFIKVMGYPSSKVIGHIVINDISILSIIIIFSIIYQKKKRFYFILPVYVLCILYLFDIELYQSLYRRLTYINIYKYIDESKAISSFVSLKKLLIISIILLLIWFTRSLKFTIYKGRFIILLGILSLIVLPWISVFARPFDPFLDTVTSNILQINQRVVINRGIREDSYLQMRRLFPKLTKNLDELSFDRPNMNAPGAGYKINSLTSDPPPNIILLISESLSQVDSIRSGGLFNRLQGIDNIQSQGLTLTNVVSNGRNTSDALASLLIGIEPLPTPLISDGMLKRFPVSQSTKRNKPVSPDTINCKSNLICHAKLKGYNTIFLSNAQLGFQNNGSWLKRLGFNHVEGAGSDFFSQYPQYAFNSPPDEILYKRALEVASKKSKPFFLTLMTVSLHAPYILPDNKDRADSNALVSQLKYVDRTTSTFYSQLRDFKFFDKGVLLIVGDHRRMTPLEPEELNNRGIDSLGRVVTSFIGKGFEPGIIDNTPLNHSDLAAMLYRLVYGKPIPINKLKYFNKGYLLGLNEPFSSHSINDSYGLMLIRRPQKSPLLFQLHNAIDPFSISKDAINQKIVTYLAMSSGWLAERQKIKNVSR